MIKEYYWLRVITDSDHRTDKTGPLVGRLSFDERTTTDAMIRAWFKKQLTLVWKWSYQLTNRLLDTTSWESHCLVEKTLSINADPPIAR